ncbi:MAG: HU family DNA-binding protein [Rickettsiales bacterium]
MALTKKQISKKINSKVGIAKLESLKIVDSFFNELKKAVKEKDIVKLTHFGTFKTIQKGERIGRNPKTKETAVIEKRKIVSFNPTTKLKNKVNKKSK